MPSYTESLETLMKLLGSLPGIGARSAERIAFHLLKLPSESALRLADAIRDVKTRIRHCEICSNLTEQPTCLICQDPARDASTVCVVEQPKDLLAIESAGLYKGHYHVLLGRISPQHDEHADDLTIDQLRTRLAQGNVREVILGTNPNLDGDMTSLHLQELLRNSFPTITVTRLARGLAAGSSIEHASRSVLSDAITSRQKLD